MAQLQTAIPLVLPNNCSWNPQRGTYEKSNDVKRETLVLQENALDELRKIKGPVCVVAVTGPCRNGKSFILGEAFGHSEVFALGHTMKPETMGIWMWIVPEKITDKNNREFTVVLIDSEGIDSTEGDSSSDHRIFTLSVLLSSILLYNSTGVPKGKDLNDLDCVINISERIQVFAGTKNTNDERQRMPEVFPYFIWLLRDVTLGIPGGHTTFKDYLLKEILNANNKSQSENARRAADNIISFFSGFDAFEIPIPSIDPSVVQNLSDPNVKKDINPKFLSKINEFKSTILNPLLCPKRSTNKGEWVTGEGLAALAVLFVEELNTPGAVPNFQNSWDTFVHTTCSEALKKVIEMYKVEIKSQVGRKIPCEADVLRLANEEVIKKCTQTFQKETLALSAESVKEYQGKIEAEAAAIFEKWMEENRSKTAAGCKELLKNLKENNLHPVLNRLRSPEAAKMEYKEVIEAYDKIEKKYNTDAKGAKEVKAAVFMDFLPEFREEMKQNMAVLETMKDYDADIENEKAKKAAIEEVQRANEELIAKLEDEKKAREREWDAIKKKFEEDKKRFKEEFARKEKENKDQMENMMKTQREKMKEDRELFLQQQKTLEDRCKQLEEYLKKKDEQIKDLDEHLKEVENRSVLSLLKEAGYKIVKGVMDFFKGR